MSWTLFFQLGLLILLGGFMLCLLMIGIVECIKALRNKKGE